MLIIVAATIAAVVLVAAGGLYWFFSGDGMRRALEQQATAWLGQPVRIKAARGQLFPRPGIGLSGVEVGEPVRLTLSSVDLSTDLRALLNRRIEDARVVISDSTIQMPLPFAIPEQDGSSKDEASRKAQCRSSLSGRSHYATSTSAAADVRCGYRRIHRSMATI